MEQNIIYTIRIKIVAMRFRTKLNAETLTLSCTLDSSLLAQKEVILLDGLLAENTTLTFELNAATVSRSKSILLEFVDKEISELPIGTTSINLNEFQSVKMRRFAISTSEENNAHIQAFLLMLQSRIIEEPQVSPINIKKSPFCRSQLSESSVHIDVDSGPQTPKSLAMSHHSYTKTSSHEAETQTYNIESLLTINSILEESNANLQRDNEELRKKLSKIQQCLESQQSRKHIQHQYKLRIEEMNDEIEMLKESLIQSERKIEEKMSLLMIKDQEMERKNASIEEIKQENTRLMKQLARERENGLNGSIKDLNLDHIMTELSKYSQTAKRYRSTNYDSANHLKTGSLKDSMKTSSRAATHRQSLKIYSNSKVSSAEQTADSLTESKII